MSLSVLHYSGLSLISLLDSLSGSYSTVNLSSFPETETVCQSSCLLFQHWSVLDTWDLEEAEVDFGQSLVRCPEVPQKRQSLLSRQCCCSCGVSFPSFPSFEERSGVVDFFCLEVEPLPWVELELLFFCLELKNLCQTCCQTC